MIFLFFQYFPRSYEQPYLINELLLISKFFKNCGKGCLLNKDKIYYYNTYIPSVDNNNIINTKKNIFLLFLCDTFYKQKYIDEFTNNIFILLDKDVFDNNKLKNNNESTINDLFDIYKTINNKEEIYQEYVHNLMNNAMEDKNIGANNSSFDKDVFTSKRIDSEFIRKSGSLKSIRNNSGLMENIEMVKITENDTDLTMMFKIDKYNYYSMKMRIYKTIKIINIIIFSILSLFTFILILIIFSY